MAITVTHTSASSAQKFVECPASWSQNYDRDTKVHSRNEWTDAGNYVHAALEKWRNPELNLPVTFESLQQCYFEVAEELKLTETLAVFKRGLQLLEKAFAMATTHPTLPIHLLKTIAVEAEIAEYLRPGWAMTIKGFIDHLGVITPKAANPAEIILVVEDYKTGKAKTWTELVEDDIQPPLYLIYALDILKPHLEAQGYKVLKTVLVWTYINDGSAVVMYESDFDLDTFSEYIGSITRQMRAFIDDYNALTSAADISAFLVKYEKPNRYCGYCPRKNTCQSFQRLLKMDAVIDITTVSWPEIKAERERAQALEKYGYERKKDIDDLIRVYLDQERLETIVMEDIGYEMYANQQTNEFHSTQTVREVLGEDFVLRAAEFTKKAVEQEIAKIALSDPDRARQITEELQARICTKPGARIVRTRLIPKPKGRKSGKDKPE